MNNHLKPIEHVLRLANPAIFDKVQLLERLYPQLNGRALRGGILAAGNAVKAISEDPLSFHVTSTQGVNGNDGLGYYIVQLGADGAMRFATCTCPDYFKGVNSGRYGAPRVNGNPRCKHVIAVSILPIPMRAQYLNLWMNSGHIERGPGDTFLLDPCASWVEAWEAMDDPSERAEEE